MTQQKKKSFALGYSYIFHSMISYWLFAAAASTGLNIIVPQFAAKTGIEQTSVLSANTVGAFFSCIFVFLLGKVIAKKGIRFTTTVSAIAAGILGAIMMCYVHNLIGYAICTIFAQGLVYGYSYSSTNALITNWWPRKKGVIMGITTTGIMWASLTLVPWMSTVGNTKGFNAMMWMLGGILIVFGIVSFFWLRERPEDVGLDPDNIPLSEEEKKDAYFQSQSQEEAVRKWPVSKMLRNKYAWFIMIAFGILFMFTSGVASTTVAFAIEAGFAPPAAVKVMSMTALVGVGGSVVMGAIDTKWGPKTAAMICAIWVALSFFSLLVFHGTTGAIVCLCMANVTMGSIANLGPSIIATCFGRDCFTQSYRIIYTGVYLIRSLCFIMIGSGVSLLGSYRSVYIVFGVVAIVAGICIAMINDKVVQQPVD